jgi:hypothetical protein
MVLMSGCSFSISGEPCSGDSDCAEQAICADGFCAATCSNDSDCQDPERTCQPFVRSGSGETENVCLVDDPADVGVDETGPEACTTDQECRERLEDEQAACGIGGTCIIQPDNQFAVLLVDTTDAMPLPDDGAPGADIAAAFLAPEGGSHEDAVAWGTSLRYEPIGDIDTAPHLDGSSLPFTEDDQCVAGPFASTTSPLGGLGGRMLLRFVDADGDEVPIAPGMEIHIVEWGPNCEEGLTQVDRFEAYLCTTRTNSFVPTDDCRQRMGEGGAYQRFVPNLDE